MRSDPPQDPGASPGAEQFSGPCRLHPASVVLGIDVRRLVQVYLVPALATFALAGLTLVVIAAFAAVVLLIRFLEWQRFTYAFDGETLRVDQGVVSRDHRALDVARIQQVEIDRSFLQRMFGLAMVRVETAGGAAGDAAVELRVIPDSDAVALRSALLEERAQAIGAPDVEPGFEPADRARARREVLRVPLTHVVLGAVTGARLLVFPAVLVGAFELGGQLVEDWVERVAEEAVRQGVIERNEVVAVTFTAVALLVAAVVVISFVTAIAVGILRDARFRIEQAGDDLQVSRGLLSTRTSVLPRHRIQMVEIRRNWVRRLLGYAQIRVSSAGGSAAEDRRVTVPLLPEGGIDGLLGEIYPGVAGPPDLVGHPRAALRRAVFRWTRISLVPIAAVWLLPFVWLEWLRWPVFVLLPLAAALGVVEYRQLAHGIDDRLVAARRGALSVRTSLAPLVKVQGATTVANPFQRRLGLATVTAHVAGPGGDVEILDVGAGDGSPLQGRLAEWGAGRPGSRVPAP